MQNPQDEDEREIEATRRRVARKRQIKDITTAFGKKRFSGEVRHVRDLVETAHALLGEYDTLEEPPEFADDVARCFDASISQFAALVPDAPQ